MRKLLLIFAIICGNGSTYSQKIVRCEIDKFTKKQIIETSGVRLYTQYRMGLGFTNVFECGLRKVNDIFSMPAKILTPKIEKYAEKDGVTFLLENDETVFLPTNHIGVSGDKWNQGYWYNTSLSITPKQADLLRKYKVTTIRVSYLRGHYDHDVIDDNQDKIIKMFRLIDSLAP